MANKKVEKMNAKQQVIHHFKYHRLEWSLGIGSVCFILGFIIGIDLCKHVAEFTLIPAFDALLTKTME
jgi:hypothetical protein